MDYDHIRLKLEKKITIELYDLFEGKIIEQIIKQGKVDTYSNYVKLIYEGNSFKVSKNLSPKLHSLCVETQEALHFNEKIDFFITNSSEANAFTVSRFEDDDNHIIVLNSILIENFDEDELKFIIGHEIGHLISKNSDFNRIIDFVFPEDKAIPLIFLNKINLWDKLAELSADRYGFIASPKLDKCISTFFKLASGLNTAKLDFKPIAYLDEMEKIIQKYRNEPLSAYVSHPVNPVRILAIKYLSESETYRRISAGESPEEDIALNEKISKLVETLMVLSSSDLDIQRTYFFAAGGLMTALIDKNISEIEMDYLVQVLSQFTIFPKQLLDQIIESGELEKIFSSAAQSIIEQNPSERFSMFRFLIDLILIDRGITNKEIDFLYDVGSNLFSFIDKEIAQLIGEAIQDGFIPKLYKGKF